MRKLFVAILVVAGAVYAGTFPPLGAPAPSFQLKSQESRPVSLGQFRGQWVVLYFYPKDFTGGCTLEAHNFQRDLEEYRKRNATIVGVSVDSSDSHARFCAKESLTFHLLADPGGKVSSRYNSTMQYLGHKLSARNTFIIGPDGVLRKIFSPVKPAGHSEEVLAALDQLQKNDR